MKTSAFLVSVLVAVPLSAQLVLQPPTLVKTICSDSIAVTNFTVSPYNPAPNVVVTVEMTIKNNCADNTSIPWRIARNSQVLDQNVITVEKGYSAVVKATWTSYAGNHHFYGDADPNAIIGDGTRANNTRAADVSIAPEIDHSMIDVTRALSAGARNTQKFETAGDCSGSTSYIPSNPEWGPSVSISCSLTGGKSEHEVYTTATGAPFLLKNGWKVERVDVSQPKCVSAGWSWVSGAPGPPLPDQNNPYMKFRMWANLAGSCTVYVKTYIYGPKGTDPYVCQSGIDCNTGFKY
jgi:hypothetical protein